MKKITKIGLSLIPISVVGVVAPIGVSVFNLVFQDLIFASNIKKETTLSYIESESGNYYTAADRTFWLIFRYYTFPNTAEEQDKHNIHYKICNMKWSTDLIELEGEHVKPEISLHHDTWSHKSDDETICNGFAGHFIVEHCTMKSGAWISFDVRAKLCRSDDESKDVTVAKYSYFEGFKLTFN